MIIHTAKTSLHNKSAVAGSNEVTFEMSPSVHVLRLMSTLATNPSMYTTLQQSDGRLPQQMFPHLMLLDPLPSQWVGNVYQHESLWSVEDSKMFLLVFFIFHFYDISKVCFAFKPNSTFSGSTLKYMYLYTDPRHWCVNIKHDYWFTGGLAR